MAADGTGLEQLLRAEERLDRMLAGETREAAALVADAEAEAGVLEGRLAAELAEATQALEARLAAERDARLAFAEGEARRHLACYARIGAREVDDLAAWVIARVLESAAGAG